MQSTIVLMIRCKRMQFNSAATQGFTLVELLIAIAILGVVSSIALVSATNYIEQSEAGVMNHNYEIAIDTARTNFVAARQMRDMGADVTSVVPDDSPGWVGIFNTTGSSAPGGGFAYEVGAGSNVNGAIGIAATGTYAGRDATITISRPAYAGMPASSVVIAQVDM